MGMYDKVWVACPKCGKNIEEQSKAGECLLIDYTINNAPLEILVDIDGGELYCEPCDHYFRIRIPQFRKCCDHECKSNSI